jgi:hypothetical protein
MLKTKPNLPTTGFDGRTTKKVHQCGKELKFEESYLATIVLIATSTDITSINFLQKSFVIRITTR